MKPRNAAAIPSLIILAIMIFTSCVTSVNNSPAEKPDTGMIDKPRQNPYETIESMVSEGDSKSAVKEFEKVKNDDPETIIAYAGLLMASGDYEKAAAELEALIERVPENAAALYNLALVRGFQGDLEAETDLLEKAIAADSGHSGALSVRGTLYLSDSKYKKASEMFNRALESDPDNVMALTGYGSTLIRLEKYKEAEPYLNRAVELDPENQYTYLDRSSVRASLGNVKGAEEDLSAAIELEPDYFWNYLDRGRLRLRRLGDADGALDDFNRAIEIEPAIFYPYVFRAGIYDDRGELEKAAEDYRFVISVKPDYYFAYSSLGITAFMLENWDESRKSFEKAFKFEPKEYAYLAMACIAQLKQGDSEAAKNYIIKTMDKIPSTDIYYHILRAYREKGYDAYALRLIREKDDRNLEKRLLFYIAEIYQASGMDTAAFSYFTLVRDAKDLGFFESRLAEYELENNYERN